MLDELVNIIKSGSNVDIENFIVNNDSVDVVYFLVFFNDLKKLRYVYNNNLVDFNKVYVGRGGVRRSLLDLAYIWGCSYEVVDFLRGIGVGSVSGEVRGNSVFSRRVVVRRGDSEYEYYLSKFRGFLNNNSNFKNLRVLNNVLVEGDGGGFYNVLEFCLMGGNLDERMVGVFDLNKVLILVLKRVCDVRRGLDLVYRNKDRFKSVDDVKRFINFCLKEGIGYDYKKFRDVGLL